MRLSSVGGAAGVLLLALLASPSGTATAQPGGRYYSETGHTLDSTFELFFHARGGPGILGFPITEAFVDPLSGHLIQYFENARLELAPDPTTQALKVRLADLGVLIGGWDLPLPASRLPIGRSPGCRYYPASGHQVCHAFLDFYERHGGPATFGAPISEFRLERARIVQYFHHYRLEWFPEAERGGPIRIAALGREHFQRMGYSSDLLAPVDPADRSQYEVLRLRPSASVLNPLLKPGATQFAYLVVSDQNNRPVEGAAALLAVYLPDGLMLKMMPLTDRNGVSRLDLRLDGQLPGTRITLEYTVVYAGLSALTRDSFYLWW